MLFLKLILPPIAAMSAVVSLAMFADVVDAIDESGVTGLVTKFGSTGILVWYLYYNVRFTIPRLVAEFRDEMKLEREQTRENQKHFRTAIHEARNAFMVALGKPPIDAPPEKKPE